MVDAQIRRAVADRLPAACVADRGCAHVVIGGCGVVIDDVGSIHRHQSICGVVGVAVCHCADKLVRVDWHLVRRQRERGCAALLAKADGWRAGSIARMNRRTAAQVGQGKSRAPVTAVSGAKDRKQGGVLSNRQKLAVS